MCKRGGIEWKVCVCGREGRREGGCVCACVCEGEREGGREGVCVCLCV